MSKTIIVSTHASELSAVTMVTSLHWEVFLFSMEFFAQQGIGLSTEPFTDYHNLCSVIVIGCSVAGIAGLALAGYCWYK